MLTKSDKTDIKEIVEEIVLKSHTTLATEIKHLERKIDTGFKKNHKDHETIIKFANEEILDLKTRTDKIESIPVIAHELKKKS